MAIKDKAGLPSQTLSRSALQPLPGVFNWFTHTGANSTMEIFNISVADLQYAMVYFRPHVCQYSKPRIALFWAFAIGFVWLPCRSGVFWMLRGAIFCAR